MLKIKFVTICLVFTIIIMSIFPTFAIDTLDHSDFKQESWSKTVDFYDYVRKYAAYYNRTLPSNDSHAYLYLTYVNVSGLQMFYAGLSNITANQKALTIPAQTVMLHYKSKDGLKDVVTASSFMMLLAFSEYSNTTFQLSPDINDTLYASFSLGYDLTEYFDGSAPPALSSKTEIIPLTSSPDKLKWYWGMRYTNLTAIWWRIFINPLNPIHELHPIALSRYDELTFTYNLTINPETGNATLNTNYIIGKMRNLWVFRWHLRLLPFAVHYNATGSYTIKGIKISDENIYDFLQDQGIKMSIVQFQSTVVLDHAVYFNSSGANVTDSEVFVDNSTISTFTDDGEKIFDADFATKREYNLYNYTYDPTETSFETYNTTTRTSKIRGFAHNPIFNVHTPLMRLLPLVLAHIDPELYQRAKDHLLDMTRADYFYITAYPVYSGYRIEHDPTYTAYVFLTTEEPTPPPSTPTPLPSPSPTPTSSPPPPSFSPLQNVGILVIVGLMVAAVIAYTVIRRKH